MRRKKHCTALIWVFKENVFIFVNMTYKVPYNFDACAVLAHLKYHKIKKHIFTNKT